MIEERTLISDSDKVEVSVIYNGIDYVYPSLSIIIDDRSNVYIDNFQWVYKTELIDKLGEYVRGAGIYGKSSYVDICRLLVDNIEGSDIGFPSHSDLVDTLILLEIAQSKGWFESERRKLHGSR